MLGLVAGERHQAETRAYLASDRTKVWPEQTMSIGVPVPFSASWVSAEWRSWRSVAAYPKASDGRQAAETAWPGACHRTGF